MDLLRLAGAQIPCSDNLQSNVKTIKEAIDWASENNVDYIVTPEGSLSGFITDFDTRDRTPEDLEESLHTVVNYAASKKIGLFLGTMYIDAGIRRNQIRVYDKTGQHIDNFNKTYIMPNYEYVEPENKIKLITLPEAPDVHIAGLLCNDMWGNVLEDSPVCLPKLAKDFGAKLIIHSTNGLRGTNDMYDHLFKDWHAAWLKVMSYFNLPILTVDNSIEMDGNFVEHVTASESGFISDGVWKTTVPRKGTQYFYYDISILRLTLGASI